MSDQEKSKNWRRDELLSLLSCSGTLAGLCITIVALMNTIDKEHAAVSIVDDMLAICAMGFLLCMYLIFWALGSSKDTVTEMLIRWVDALFLLTMTSMTIAAFIMIYTIW